jgi:hypothetical protein
MKSSWQLVSVKVALVVAALGLDASGHLSAGAMQLVTTLIGALGAAGIVAAWHGAASLREGAPRKRELASFAREELAAAPAPLAGGPGAKA